MCWVAYLQRCIPLVWRCYAANAYPSEGQVRMILGLLRLVQQGLPTGMQPLIQADRGIGTSPTLLRGIAQLQWRYLVRVQNGVRLRTCRNKTHRPRNLVKRGEAWSGQGYVFKKNGSIRAFVHVVWDWQETDMWSLLTNDPHLAYQSYALRNWQEQSFRDLKSGGFNWQRSQVRQPTHAQRLLLVLALAYLRVLSFDPLLLHNLTNPIYVFLVAHALFAVLSLKACASPGTALSGILSRLLPFPYHLTRPCLIFCVNTVPAPRGGQGVG